MDWLISANSDRYNYAASFRDYGFVDWIKEGLYSLGDIVYIYATKPVQRILYKTRVDKIFAPGDSINDDYKYWKNVSRKGYANNLAQAHVRLTLIKELPPDNPLTYDALCGAGLPCAPQTVMHLFGDVLSFVQKAFEDGPKAAGDDKPAKPVSTWNREIDGDLRGISYLLIPLVDYYRHSHSVAHFLFAYYGDSVICEALHKEAMSYIHKVYLHQVLRQEERIIVLASLSMISIFNYDGAFWPYVHRVYSDLYNPSLGNNSQAMDAAIKDILTRGFDVCYPSDQIIISIPVMAGILSVPMLNDFINFVAEIYRLNFENMLLPTDLENQAIVKEVFNAIQKQKSSDRGSDEVELKVGSTPKTYKLSKYLIVDIDQGFYQDDLLYATMVFLKKIDAYHWSRTLPRDGTFYDEGFDHWVQDAESKSHLDPTEADNPDDPQTRDRRIYVPHFTMENEGTFNLVTEPARLASDTNTNSVVVEVTEDGQNPQSYTPALKPVISGYLLGALKNIPIHNVLGHVSYVIRNEDGVIWSSGETLYRDFVFFGEDGEEILPGHRYEGSAFCLSRFPLFGKGVKECDPQNGIYTYSFIIDPQSVYRINSKKIFFDSYDHPGLFGEMIPDVSALKEGKEIPLFRSFECLAFETALSAEQLAVVCDGVRRPLKELPFTSIQDGAVKRFVVSLKISEGYHEIYVEEVAKEKGLDQSYFAFVLDSLFQKTEMMISGAFLPASQLPRSADVDYVDFQTTDGFAYRAYSPEPFFGLDGGPIQKLAGERGKNEFVSATFLELHCGVPGILRLEEGVDVTELPLQKATGHVGFYVINPIIGMLSEHEIVTLSYTTMEGRRFAMDVHAHAFVNDQNITVNVDEEKGTALISGVIHGKGDEEVHLQIFEKEKCLFDQVVDSAEFALTIPGLQPFTPYRYVLLAKPSFFDNFAPFALHSGEFSYTSEQGLIGHHFLLKRIQVTTSSNGEVFVTLLHAARLSVYKKDDFGEYIATIEKFMGNHYEKMPHLPLVHIVSIEERTADALSVKLASEMDALFYDNINGCVFDGETSHSVHTIDLGILTICE
jgi:hypothetical protein